MVKVIALGNAQDAGLPQAGCACENCESAWASPDYRRWVTSLALVDSESRQWFLVDATPDFKEQLRYMRGAMPDGKLAGILITHAHMGHYTGLLHLGYEAMAAKRLPVYGTARFNQYLRGNAPWRQLIDMQNIVLNDLAADTPLTLTPALSVLPLAVPHRDEWSDTVAFIVRGSSRRLLYIPDIDSWDRWATPVRQLVEEVEVALLDAAFFSAEELPNRDLSKIGHPFAIDTAARLRGVKTDVRLTHLNHSNPLHRRSPQRHWLAEQGLLVVATGDTWEL